MGKFKKGLFLGGILGAVGSWLFTTKKGGEVREQLLDHAAEAYTHLREELMSSATYEKLTKAEYGKKVKKFVELYAQKHKLQAESAKMVTDLLMTQWKQIRKDLKK